MDSADAHAANQWIVVWYQQRFYTAPDEKAS
jgi:hypothetical protein